MRYLKLELGAAKHRKVVWEQKFNLVMYFLKYSKCTCSGCMYNIVVIIILCDYYFVPLSCDRFIRVF